MVSKRRILTLVSGLMFFYGFMLGGIQLVVADIAAYYGIGTAGIGVLVAAQHIAAVIAPTSAGLLADKIGKKPVLTVFSGLFCLGCAIAGVSQMIIVYFCGAFLIGCGYSVCESVSSAVLSDLDRERSMQYINITQALLSTGAIISPFIIRMLGSSWRSVFIICAVAFGLLTIMSVLSAYPTAAKVAKAEGEKQKRGGFFRSMLFCCLFGAIIMYVGLENGFGYFIDTFFEERGSLEAFGAYAISAYWAGQALGRFACGARKYDIGRMVRTCFAAIIVLFVALIFCRNDVLGVVLSLLIGVAYAPVWSTLVAGAAAAFPDRNAAAIGLMSTGCALGGILFPVLMGAVAGHFDV
ncbi:MAG: MFS transporter, partial [Clostridia bacterium]|nr:MFS transporter [Clostridia bacterium]